MFRAFIIGLGISFVPQICHAQDIGTILEQLSKEAESLSGLERERTLRLVNATWASEKERQQVAVLKKESRKANNEKLIAEKEKLIKKLRAELAEALAEDQREAVRYIP